MKRIAFLILLISLSFAGCQCECEEIASFDEKEAKEHLYWVNDSLTARRWLDTPAYEYTFEAKKGLVIVEFSTLILQHDGSFVFQAKLNDKIMSQHKDERAGGAVVIRVDNDRKTEREKLIQIFTGYVEEAGEQTIKIYAASCCTGDTLKLDGTFNRDSTQIPELSNSVLKICQPKGGVKLP